jgi:hypothetical protein
MLQEKYREGLEALRGKTYIERRGYFADAARLKVEMPGGGDEEAESKTP